MKNGKVKDAIIVILGLILIGSITFSAIQATTPNTGPYYLDVPFGSASYFIGIFANGTYYSIAASTWHVTTSTNFTALCNTDLSSGDVQLQAGTFTIAGGGGLTISASNRRLTGTGYNTILQASSLSDHMIDVSNDNTIIRDMDIDGTGQTSGHGIYYHGSGSGLRIEQVIVEDCYQDGISLGSGSGDGWQGNWAKINTVQIRNNGRYGIYFNYDATDTELSDFLVSGHSGSGDAGLNVEADNVRITTGHLWGNENELLLAEERSVSGAVFSNVGFMDGGSQGTSRIKHTSGSYYAKDITISGGEVWAAKLAAVNASDGIEITGLAYSISITGVVFRGENEVGTHQGRYAIHLSSDVEDCVILGNTADGFCASDPYYENGATGLLPSTLADFNSVHDCG
jgi:phage baseplate assembly protein gpV